MEQVYNKLVRYNIPNIIEQSGKKCFTETLSKEEYINALNEKIGEELAEYISEPCLEELADMVEVIYTVTVARGFSLEELESTRKAKAEKRGGFKKRIFLRSVIEE